MSDAKAAVFAMSLTSAAARKHGCAVQSTVRPRLGTNIDCRTVNCPEMSPAGEDVVVLTELPQSSGEGVPSLIA